MKIKKAITMARDLISKGRLLKDKETMQKVVIPARDARDTILKIKIKIAHTTIEAKEGINTAENLRLNPKIAPKLVATPLPPFPFRKIVQLCPTTAATATAM